MNQEAGIQSWPEVYSRLLQRGHLSRQDCAWAMSEIMRGQATSAQIAGFLMALHAKGETVEEMRGLADEMLAHATRIQAPEPSLDVVGTGGDRAHTVNISTMAAMVCAAAGVTVVKHGNRAASSKSGSADVLEALGIDLSLPASRVGELVGEVGITFCFAQQFHPSMRHAAGTRREIGVPTAFNFLGPLTNPGQPTYAAVGCADARMAPILAGVFAGRGRDAAVFRATTVWMSSPWRRPRRSGGCATAMLSNTNSIHSDWVWRWLRPRRCEAGTRHTTRRWCVTCSPGRRVPCETRWSSTPGPRWLWPLRTTPGAPMLPCMRMCGPGWSGPLLRLTPGPPRIWSSAGSRRLGPSRRD
jgi:hypothetical protein